MCHCDSSTELFTPACDYIWAVARWDAGDRLWRVSVEHLHSGRKFEQNPTVGSFIDSGAASRWLSSVVGVLLTNDAGDPSLG